MAVPYDRSIYVDAKGKKIGSAPAIATYLGKWLSEKYKKPIRVTLVPTLPGQLLQSVASGQADFAMGYVDEYAGQLDPKRYIVYPHPRHEKHVLVSSAAEPAVTNLAALSGKTIYLGRQTDTTVIDTLNVELKKTGKSPISIYRDRQALDDEDLLQMLNDGLLPQILVANWKADLWRAQLPNIRINPETATVGATTEGVIIRTENRALADDIMAFVVSPECDKALTLYRDGDYRSRRNALKNPLSPESWRRYQSMRPMFERYGKMYGLEPLFVTSLGFQETMLNQSLVSPMGAIGVMQLLPATGASMKVGNIRELEPNIHAGAKYMRSLLGQVAGSEQLTRMERSLFAVAAYNAGPNNISKARQRAAELGFDPNRWFMNVEMVAARMVGEETFLYVRNVYKYYVTYDVNTEKAPESRDALIKGLRP